MTLPDGPAGRSLALCLLLLLVVALGLAVGMPLRAHYHAGEELLAEREALLRRYTALLDRSRAALVGQPAGDVRARTLEGPSDAVATAELIAIVKTVMSDSGNMMETAETLPIGELDGFRQLGLRIAGTGNLAGIAKALAALDRAAPLLLVPGLTLTAERAASGTAARGQGGSDPLLRWGLEIVGFRGG